MHDFLMKGMNLSVSVILRYIQIFIFFLFVMGPICVSAEARAGFFNVGHMTNTVHAIDWALSNGSNAVEVDLQFDKSGSLTMFYHGFPCDCSCNLSGDAKVCQQLGEAPCQASSSVAELLHHMTTRPQLALVVVDSKVSGLKSLEMAGVNTINVLDKVLFENGYKGIVLVSVADVESLKFLKSASTHSASSKNSLRYYFSIDQNGDDVIETVESLISLEPLTKNRVYGTGIHTCSLFGDFQEAIQLASMNQLRGVIGSVYVWTVDDESSMERYISSGAFGIITNHPSRLSKVLRRRGIKLLAPGSYIPGSTSDSILNQLH